MQLWFKIIISCVPAAIVGLLFDEVIEDMFYNGVVVAGALIIYGVLFIVVENWNKGRRPVITTVAEIGYNSAILLVCSNFWQLSCLVHPDRVLRSWERC